MLVYSLWERSDSDHAVEYHLANPIEVSRSRSSDCLHKVSVSSGPTNMSAPQTDSHLGVVRSRSYSDTERSLEQVMKDLEMMLMDNSTEVYDSHQRHLSNDSAVGESEEITSPLQHSRCAKPSCSSNGESTHEVSNSVDSAFSNNSSHTSSVSSTEAVNGHDVRLPSPPHYASASLPLHTRMSSGVSIQSDSLSPSSNSIIFAHSPKLPHKTALTSSKYSSLPVLDPQSDTTRNPLAYRQSPSPFSLSHKFRKSSSAGKEKKNKRKRSSGSGGSGSVEDMMPEYNPRRSPILMQHSLREAAELSHNTPNQTLSNDHTPMSSFSTSANIDHRFHFKVDPSTEVLI